MASRNAKVPKVKRTPKRSAPQQKKKPGGQQVSAPVAIGAVVQKPRQRMRTKKNGNTIVANTEYIGEVLGSTLGFLLGEYVINPGLQVAFPWLSKIARNFESYKFNKLKFRTGTEASTATPGFVALGVDYDAQDSALTSKQELMNKEETVRAPAWKPVAHTCSSENLSKRKSYFVRTDDKINSEDPRFFDTGKLQVAVGGQTSSTVPVGELWVDYEIELMTPQFDNPSIDESYKLIGTLTSAVAGTPFGTGVTYEDGFGADTIAYSSSGNSVFTFLRNYNGLVSILITGTGLTAGTVLFSSASRFTGLSNINNAAQTVISHVFVCNAIPGDVVTVGETALTTVTAAVLRVGSYDKVNYGLDSPLDAWDPEQYVRGLLTGPSVPLVGSKGLRYAWFPPGWNLSASKPAWVPSIDRRFLQGMTIEEKTEQTEIERAVAAAVIRTGSNVYGSARPQGHCGSPIFG